MLRLSSHLVAHFDSRGWRQIAVINRLIFEVFIGWQGGSTSRPPITHARMHNEMLVLMAMAMEMASPHDDGLLAPQFGLRLQIN